MSNDTPNTPDAVSQIAQSLDGLIAAKTSDLRKELACAKAEMERTIAHQKQVIDEQSAELKKLRESAALPPPPLPCEELDSDRIIAAIREAHAQAHDTVAPSTDERVASLTEERDRYAALLADREEVLDQFRKQETDLIKILPKDLQSLVFKHAIESLVASIGRLEGYWDTETITFDGRMTKIAADLAQRHRESLLHEYQVKLIQAMVPGGWRKPVTPYEVKEFLTRYCFEMTNIARTRRGDPPLKQVDMPEPPAELAQHFVKPDAGFGDRGVATNM